MERPPGQQTICLDHGRDRPPEPTQQPPLSLPAQVDSPLPELPRASGPGPADGGGPVLVPSTRTWPKTTPTSLLNYRARLGRWSDRCHDQPREAATSTSPSGEASPDGDNAPGWPHATSALPTPRRRSNAPRASIDIRPTEKAEPGPPPGHPDPAGRQSCTRSVLDRRQHHGRVLRGAAGHRSIKDTRDLFERRGLPPCQMRTALRCRAAWTSTPSSLPRGMPSAVAGKISNPSGLASLSDRSGVPNAVARANDGEGHPHGPDKRPG